MTIGSLAKVMKPPDNALDRGEASLWGQVESKIGTHLPEDYKQFINTYGTGVIGDFLWIFNPFTENKYLNLLIQADLQAEGLRPLRNEFPEDWVHPIYPEEDGILSFGVTENGDNLFWKTSGSPALWTVIVYDEMGPLFEEYPYNLTDFLERLVSNELRSEIIGEAQFNRQVPFKVQNSA